MENITHYETISEPTHVLCDWPYCSAVVKADDANWDDRTDSGYCSPAHKAYDIQAKRLNIESPYAEDTGMSGYRPWIGGQR